MSRFSVTTFLKHRGHEHPGAGWDLRKNVTQRGHPSSTEKRDIGPGTSQVSVAWLSPLMWPSATGPEALIGPSGLGARTGDIASSLGGF
jgi:hypothetical protein